MREISRQRLWRGRFIEAVSIRYEDRGGVVREWEAVGRVGSRAVVVVVPFTSEGGLLLIRQYRPALDRYVIELPAGLVDDPETLEGAARRELIEETGHFPAAICELTGGVISNGINMEPWHVMLATGCEPAPEDVRGAHQADENEDIEVLSVGAMTYHDDIAGLLGPGDTVDLRLYGLVELALRQLGRGGAG